MTEIRVSEIRVSEIRVSKIRVSKIRVTEIRVSKIRVSKIRVSKIRISSNHHELHGVFFFVEESQSRKTSYLEQKLQRNENLAER